MKTGNLQMLLKNEKTGRKNRRLADDRTTEYFRAVDAEHTGGI